MKALLVLLCVMLSSIKAFRVVSQRAVLRNVVFRRFGSSENTVVSRCTANLTRLLKPVRVTVTSTNDDPNGSHIKVDVVSEEFTGKSIVQRHKMVYKALWDELNDAVHAVDAIVAKTPKEVGL